MEIDENLGKIYELTKCLFWTKVADEPDQRVILIKVKLKQKFVKFEWLIER